MFVLAKNFLDHYPLEGTPANKIISISTMTERQDFSQRQTDQINLRDLILKIGGLVRFLVSKWLFVIMLVALGGALGVVYSIVKKTNYIGRLTFVLQEQSGASGSLGSAANIAVQFGLNIGGLTGSGGFF